jgi:hypothetical protein
MFDNNRYVTIGVKNAIPIETQLFIWNCIDTLRQKGQKLDYLQVFELTQDRTDDILFQKIEHRQEVPKYEKVYRIFPTEMISSKIFVIDDRAYSTMLLAEEY